MHGHQESPVARAAEAPIRCQPNRRNEIVDMRMVTQIARPGLEYAQHAELPANKARIGGQLLQRRGRGAKEQGVDLPLMAVRQRAQLGWEREGYQKIRYRQQTIVLRGQPAFGSVMLTGRAVTIAAGVIAVRSEEHT